MMEREFTYGICRTDHKIDRYLSFLGVCFATVCRSNLFVSNDYSDNQRDEKWIKSVLEKFALPLPSRGKIFKGSNHHLLFLDSHGLVMRIGDLSNTDPRNFLHPHIPQPVGWITSEDHNLSISLYKAAHHFNRKNITYREEDELFDKMELSLSSAGFSNHDLDGRNNTGFILLDDGTQFPICIDTSHRIAEKTTKQKDAFNALREKGIPAHEALKVIFNLERHSFVSSQKCRDAFAHHQPLRRAFFSAWSNADKNEGEPHPEKMKKFWQMAKNYTGNGYTIIKKDGTGYYSASSVRRSPLSWKAKPV